MANFKSGEKKQPGPKMVLVQFKFHDICEEDEFVF